MAAGRPAPLQKVPQGDMAACGCVHQAKPMEARHWMLSSSARQRSRAASWSSSSVRSANQSAHASTVGETENGFRRQDNRDGNRKHVPMHRVLDKLGYIAGWVSGDQLAINEGHRTESLGNARVSFRRLLYPEFFLTNKTSVLEFFYWGAP